VTVDLEADATGTTAVIERVLAHLPDVVRALDAAHRAAWAAVEPRWMELCRLRAAQLIGCAAEAAARTPGSGLEADLADHVAQWPTHPAFLDADRDVLTWCEQFVIDVASMSDEQVEALRRHVGDDGVVNFTNALLVIEQRQRLRAMWERLGLTGDEQR
jgi:alkylhydroperoxidase family enzyme